jgi:hypothetical protein
MHNFVYNMGITAAQKFEPQFDKVNLICIIIHNCNKRRKVFLSQPQEDALSIRRFFYGSIITNKIKILSKEVFNRV